MNQEEQMQDLKNISQKFKQALTELLNLLDTNKKKGINVAMPKAVLNPNGNPFIFTGQITDLSYFRFSKTMPISAITALEPDLQLIVKSTFEKAAKEGLIDINSDTGIISITPKGEQYIQKQSFIEMAESDQTKAFANKLSELKNETEKYEVFGVELDGTKNDFNFFNHGTELDLKNIKCTPGLDDTNSKVFDNNKIVRLTDKGAAYLKSDSFIQSTKGLSEKSVSSLESSASKIIAATKKVLKVAENVLESPAQSKPKVLSK